jgi:hypothetical protein
MKIDSRDAPKVGDKIDGGVVTSSETYTRNAVDAAAFRRNGIVDGPRLDPSGAIPVDNLLILPQQRGQP